VAVLNLAINARDAMPAGGEISFTTHNCHISGDAELDDGDYVELSIGDTGAGMPPDVLARAFEPFFTTKEVGKGTGLGLSMVYGMARQSGGTVRIESEVGRGTIVRLYFRHADEVTKDFLLTHRDASEAPERQHYLILVVDDDEDVRRFIACSLEELGHDVTEAADGLSGLAEYDRQRPDLVILDYVMPGMTGAKVAAEILRRDAAQPLLFVTGYSESDAIRAAAPNAALLSKPFRPDTLDLAVRDAMGDRASLQ
jgi:CheY-like chemotaxis protein